MEIKRGAIILDLDQTLVCTFEEDVVLEEEIFRDYEYLDVKRRLYRLVLNDVVEEKKGRGVVTVLWGIVRPHVAALLDYCFKRFQIVAVWSAGQPGYVYSLIDILFKGIGRPHVVFTHDDCVYKVVDGENVLTKPIDKMINSIDGLDKYMSIRNTFSVDDNVATFAFTNPDNGIHVPVYDPLPCIKDLRKVDDCLLKLIQWLDREHVKNIEDVCILDKSNIF